ncbi:prealbumin-like fold domain-containing protein [Kribbella sp. GL6]|uniref:prealbumin-like fold domain-containing protein n=1 Tax=Kribbella sp. GL6 TaxID=3419765 RepID=UPI003D0354F5
MTSRSTSQPLRRLRRPLIFASTAALLLAMTPAADAILAGSTFEGNDGNMVVNTSGNTDWVNAPNRVRGDDLPSGSTDNAFGQGTKEDDPAVSVVTGSIPPQKSDLTRFYVGSETAGGNVYLYLAWERSNVLGSANMDFEINQKAQPNLTTTGAKTLNRTANDILITFDFTNGGGNPVLGLLRWIPAGGSGTCFSANAAPCWGNRVNLSAAGFAEGAVNPGTISEPIAGGTLAGLEFGEAAINMTAAGIFSSNVCTAFGSAFLKSRSSASFPAEVKDFVAPQPVNIANCGKIVIHKVTENGDATFGYTTTGGLSPATFNLSNGGTQTYSDTTQVQAGNYSVTESTVPAGWTLKSLVCTATGAGTSYSVSGATTNITMAPEGVVDCTYTNHINAHPSIATTLSATTVVVGGSVHDSATLSNATANAGGTVTYTVYTNTACSTGAQGAGTVTVTNGVVPDSNAITFNSTGDFYWQAAYSGDANNDPATSACTSEHLVVTKKSPSIATTLSDTTVTVGGTVHDSATLSGATSDASGTVTYTVYTDTACSTGAQDAGTVTVANGAVPDSNPITFNTAGDFYWQAVYSGDANNNGATSVCTSEHLVVAKASPAMATAPNVIPNDDATISGAFSPTGSVTFKLFAPADATCSGSAAFSQTVTVSGNGTYSTSNAAFVASTLGTWRWLVTYSGDGNNNPTTSACGVERFTLANG